MKTARTESLPAAILSAAIVTFVERGYDNTSMDDVAARASTTKRTVYSHYGSKDQLFSAALSEAVSRTRSDLPQLADVDDPSGELTRFAITFTDLSTWHGAVRLQRVVIGGMEQFSDLGAMLHRELIETAEQTVSDYLRRVAEQRGLETVAESCDSLASLFVNMASAQSRFATLLGAQAPLSDHPHVLSPSETSHASVPEAVAVFLRGTGLDGSGVVGTG